MSHSLPIPNTTYRTFTEKLGDTIAEEFVGNPGDLFWDPNTGELNVSDGKTEGGRGIKTRSIDVTSRYIDQFQWVSTFGNQDYIDQDNNDDYGSGVAVDSDGYGYVIGGNDNDGYPLIIRYYPDPEQNNIYDNAVYLDNTYDYSRGEAITVHKDPENGDKVYALASKNDYLILCQLETYLDVNWSVEIYGYNTRGGDVTTDAAGNIYVVGWSNEDGPGNKIIVAKFDPQGNLLWDGNVRVIGNYGGGRSWGVNCDGNDLYIVGRTTDDGQGGADIFVAKLSAADGSTIWQRTLGQPESYTWEYGYGIAAGKTGIYITADARDPVFNEHSVYVAKLSKSGSLVWQKYINSLWSYSTGSCVVVDGDDNVYVSGYTDYSLIVDPETNLNPRDELILLKFDKDGNTLFQKSIGQKGNDYNWYSNSQHNLAIDGQFLWVTGNSYLRYGSGSLGFAIRVSADGDNDGVYGEYTVQPTDFNIGDSNLTLKSVNLNNNSSDVSVNSASVTTSGVNYRFTLAKRAPFELNIPNGTVTAKVVRAHEIRLGDVPIKSVRPSNPYDWLGHNLYIGENAGFNDQGSYYNIVIGKYSGVHNTYGSNNIFLGKDSGYYNTTGYRNVYIGHSAGEYGTTGSYNVVIGDVYVDGNDLDYGNQLAIGSDGNAWIRGDADRNVIVDGNGSTLYLTSPNGTRFGLSVDNSGTLLFNGGAVDIVPPGP